MPSAQKSVLETRWALWTAALIFPPLGLVLWWMRKGVRVLPRMAGTLGICALAVIELFAVYGMRLKWDGSLKVYGVTFARRGRQEALLEASRARQRIQPPAPQPVAAPVALPAAPPPTAAPVRPSYWTDFRGPNRAGVYAETEIDTNWPASGLPRLWKQPIGGGYASFTVGDGRAYTIEQRRDREAITAYDPTSGRELWAFTYPALFDEIMGGAGPRATPVYRDGLVYSLGANGDLYCLSAKTGKPKWSKNILSDNGAENARWAMAASPLIVDRMLDRHARRLRGQKHRGIRPLLRRASLAIVERSCGVYLAHPGHARRPAPDRLDQRAARRWPGARERRLLWEYPFPAQMDMNCSQPVIVDESDVLLSSSPGPGAALLEISKTGDTFAARAVWHNNRMKNKFNSSVLYQGYIYGFDDAILACIDARTGELKWKGGRYGYGQLLLAGGYLVVVTEQGDVVLVRATPESHQELARFSADEGRTWNIPAIDNGLLLVRNTTEMACFRVGLVRDLQRPLKPPSH